MPDLLNVTYSQTGKSILQNSMGMREMQARAYAKRDAQYLLLKAPPACGKSRALMYIALDKINHQGLEKAIIAVPEMSIGGSFRDTDLKTGGFFADWHISDKYNLCTVGNCGKVDTVLTFLDDEKAHYLVCTHATLRFAYERIGNAKRFDKSLIAIDEFHHTSAEDGNKLGAMLDDVMENSTAHVVAMTGSYFRGDQVPILTPEAEQQFTQVTYTYYEQLNGYKYLKSLGLGYHFFQGQYMSAIGAVLDLDKKTIIHIPNVNSSTSTGMKLQEVDDILDVIGTVEKRDPDTGVMTVRTRNGKRLRVADLVTDDSMRPQTLTYLRGIKKKEEMDIIIALGMAKEGFDWPWCEHVLTIGYRSSMTEVVQIIGRATRDCEGKSHAQFTNLIPQPTATDEDVKNAVNSMLKAISLSLLMREVLAPCITFKPRSVMAKDEKPEAGTVIIEDTEHPVSDKVKKILETGGIQDVLTRFITETDVVGPAIANPEQGKLITESELPKVVIQTFPGLSPEEVKAVTDIAKTSMVLQGAGGIVSREQLEMEMTKDGKAIKGEALPVEDEDGEPYARNEFVKIADKFINVDDLSIDLIDSVNPFQGAYEILSKSVDAPLLKTIQDQVTAKRSSVTEEEAVILWPKVKDFKRQYGKEPSIAASDSYEKRLAEVLAFIRNKKSERMRQQEQA